MSVQFKFDFEKTRVALVYLSSKDIPALDKYKVCKLLFLADKYHLVRYGRPITGDLYCAMDFGPIPSETLDLLDSLEAGKNDALASALQLDHQYRYPRFSAKIGTDHEFLSNSDRMALDHTIDRFGSMTFPELRALTHEMPAYRKAWDSKPKDRNSVPMAYEDFFEEESEAIGGAFEEMLENDSLRKAFPIG